MFDHDHFLGLENFPKDDIQKIIDTSFNFKEVLFCGFLVKKKTAATTK